MFNALINYKRSEINRRRSMKTKMTIKEKLLKTADELYPCQLPIGVYVTDIKGNFVRCNDRIKEILKLPENHCKGVNINQFYPDINLRARLLKELEEKEKSGKYLEKKVIPFVVNGQHIWVQDYCRTIRDEETNDLLGFTGCLVDITEEESYKQMFEQLPIGVYKLDEENKIVRANLALAKIFGYDSPNDLYGKEIKSFYAEPEEADKFDSELRKEGAVVNRKIELLGKRFASVCAYKKMGNNHYVGREGTIMDVTEEETYRLISEHLPVGTYMVQTDEKGVEHIHHCNKAFARIFGYTDESDIQNKPVVELYKSEKDHKDFKKALEEIEKSESDGESAGIPINARSKNGSSLTLEVHCRIFEGRNSNSAGRAGVVVDISNTVALRELRDDIGKTLHTYSASLLSLKNAITPTVNTLGPTLFNINEDLNIELALKELINPAENLKNALKRLIDLGKNEKRRYDAFSENNWKAIEKQHEFLSTYREIPYPVFRISALNDSSQKVLTICSDVKKRILPKEALRDVYLKAKELERKCCLISLHQGLDTIVEMDIAVRLLREFVIFKQRKPNPFTVCKLSELIQNALQQLHPYAKNKKVDIEQEYLSCNVNVKVDERAVIRALLNLFLNAVKYSWLRSGDKKSWITVKARNFNNFTHIEVQNYGVPITREEIDTGSIFEFGYRGMYSADRRRIGTGIGLADVKEVARQHNGDIFIDSRPASIKSIEYDYSQPFLTTATLKLPVYKGII